MVCLVGVANTRVFLVVMAPQGGPLCAVNRFEDRRSMEPSAGEQSALRDICEDGELIIC